MTASVFMTAHRWNKTRTLDPWRTRNSPSSAKPISRRRRALAALMVVVVAVMPVAQAVGQPLAEGSTALSAPPAAPPAASSAAPAGEGSALAPDPSAPAALPGGSEAGAVPDGAAESGSSVGAESSAGEPAPSEPAPGETEPAPSEPAPEASASATAPNPSDPAAAEKAAVQAPPAPFNGSFTQEIAIEAPAFRGLEPKLRLSYDSSRGLRAGGLNAGYLGVGWTLEGLSEITRISRNRGLPRLDDTDTFMLDGEELVACPATTEPSASCDTGTDATRGNYTTRVESFQRIRRTADNTWIVTARDGTAYTYVSTWGFTDGNPVTDDDAGLGALAGRYRYLLKVAQDTHGNRVTYDYACPNVAICWPTAIAYNGNQIRFQNVDRTDVTRLATGASLLPHNKRLAAIEIRVGAKVARAYELRYETSPSTGLVRLASVQQFGLNAGVDTNGDVSGAPLEPTRFTYQDLRFGFGSIVTDAGEKAFGDFAGTGRADALVIKDPTPEIPGDCRELSLKSWNGSSFVESPKAQDCTAEAGGELLVGDFDGDGKAEALRFYAVPPANEWEATKHYVARYKASGGAVGVEHHEVAAVSPPASSCTAASTRRLVGDFDGDGAAELYFNGAIHNVTGGALVAKPWTGPGCAFAAGDFNGDGKTDLAVRSAASGPTTLSMHLATGAGFVVKVETSQQVGFVGHHVGDFNGDGRADLLLFKPVPYQGGQAYGGFVLFSDGRAFVDEQLWFSVATNASIAEDSAVGDFDGDGRADLAAGGYGVYLSIGTGFAYRTTAPASVRAAADIDGDGKADIAGSDQIRRVGGSLPGPIGGYLPDLMKSVETPLGGVTRVEYAPSSHWPDGKLPFVLQTVKSVTLDDGRGQDATTTYRYTGGRWHWGERRFLGFATATATLPCNDRHGAAEGVETDCPVRDYIFEQGVASAGLIRQVKFRTLFL